MTTTACHNDGRGIRRTQQLVVRCALAALLLGLYSLAATAAVGATTSASSDHHVLRATLDNGLQVIIVPNHLAPVVTAVMNYHVGSNEAPAGFPGMAHAQEHMMFRGSPGLSAGQLSAIAAAMGGRFNADTQQTVTQYFFTVPARYLDVVLHVQAIRMGGVADSQALWADERGAIEQEVARDLSNPGYVVYTQLLQHMFRGTPYSHDALGTKASFDQTTGAMLHDFYRHWYRPNNATLVIVGDVDPAQALQAVRVQLGSINSAPLPKRPQFKLQPVAPTTIQTTTDQPYGLAFMALRLPGYDSPDYAAARILAQVLGDQRAALYSQLVPTGKALAAGFQLNALRPASMALAVATFAPGASPQSLLDNMQSILHDVAQHGVDTDLVAAAKRRLSTHAAAQHGSIPGLAMQWSQALVVQQLHSPRQALQALKKVTVADVNRVAREYLDPQHAIIAILTPQPSGQPSHAGGFGGKESFAPTHVGDIELPTWAAQALATINPPESRLQPSDMYLANGLRLIVQPETTTRAIHVYGHIKNRPSLTVPLGQEGVAQVLNRLLHYGTSALDRVAFDKALDDIGAAATLGTDFSLLVLHQHLDRGLQLLAAAELQPALRRTAFKVVRQQVARAVAGELASPGFKLQQTLHKALYPAADPTLRHATPQTVAALTRQAVRAYHDKIFRPDLCTIVIVGDIQPLQAARLVRKYFGKWQANGPTPVMDLPPVPPNAPHTINVPDSARMQDKVVLAQTLGLTRSSPAYYALKLGNQVLSGGLYSSRLYSLLREQRGLVYYVGSAVNANHTRATFNIAYGAQPDDVGQAQALASQALRTMQNTPVGATELHRAKAALVRQVPLSQASQSAIASGLLARAVAELPLNEPIRAARHYLHISAQDVQQAYATWVRPDGFVRVTQGPAPP